MQVKQELELDMKQQSGSKLGKECIYQGCILSPCLFNLFAEYIMQNAGLDEVQAEIRIAGRNIDNLRYADDTTLMAESEELKSLLMKVKEKSEEERETGLKLNIQKIKIMASGPIISWQTVTICSDFGAQENKVCKEIKPVNLRVHQP